jgi:hypothetical protein
VFQKSALKGMQGISVSQTFYGKDLLAVHIPHGEAAGTYGPLVDDDGAGAAEPLAASEFGSGKIQFGTQYPEKLSVAFDL